MRYGDLVHRITSALGIRECDSCAKRREAMNAIDEDATAAEVAEGLLEALLNPEKVLERGSKEDNRTEEG